MGYALFVLLFLLACGLFGGDDSGNPACGREPPLTWANFGEGFMTKHCTGCHSSLLPEPMREGAPVGVDFDTYAAVLDWAPRIEATALGEAPAMPPGGGPGADELALLEEWLACEVAADRAALGGR